MQIELKRLQLETGITFVFVTHDQEEALTMSDHIAVMNNGRILQIGSPRDIYNSPADRFVANFIGESNFLPGKIKNSSNGTVTVAVCGSAEILASVPSDLTPVGTVTVAVRPEHATLAEDVSPGSLIATIEDVVFFGTDTHFHTRLENGDAFVVREQNVPGLEEKFRVGKRVSIQISLLSARVLRD
jgi:spermidine/putrescine transport system ATP-binding protein